VGEQSFELSPAAMPKGSAGSPADAAAAGLDEGSLVADAGFVDAAKGDYRFRPDSPARALGLEDIPLDRIGPAGCAEGGC
jgi:hypothetical protein